MWLLRVLIGVLALLGLAVAVAPEPRARPMPDARLHVISGHPGTTRVADMVERDASIPATLRADPTAVLVRSWTEAGGVRPMALEFGPLPAADYLGVLHQGTFWARAGVNSLYFRCTTSDRTRPVAVGGTNTTVTETIVPLGKDWCPDGQIYLRLVATSPHNVGVAAPFEASALAYLKQSYLGFAGYFLIAFAVVLAVFVAGGLAAMASGTDLDPVLGGLLAIGGLSLAAFYAYAWTPLPAPLGAAVALAALGGIGMAQWRAPKLLRAAWDAQRGPALAWFLVSFTTFTVLYLGATGSGSWEPAYRFAPAVWSSDHILPTVLAEAARVGLLPAEGLVGGWSLSDRPPLMAGAYLLFADLFAGLQFNNDGQHLQPNVLGVAGIVICALWAATLYWAARRIAALPAWIAGWGVAVVAATPLALFNTGYTWPKMLAAAYAVAAAAYVFRPGAGRPSVREATIFGALCGLAMMSHAATSFFLAPVALIYFADRLWKSPKAAAIGAAAGLAPLIVWALFKVCVLPSHDPLMAYALTGELILNAPEGSLPTRLAERYRPLNFADWLATKAEIAAYLLTPFPPSGAQQLARPPGPLAGAGLFQNLRNWDFFSLTIGNLPLLLLGAVGGWGALTARSAQGALAGRLLASALGCLALFMAVTFLPLFNHQFSYDAILALALAGLAVLGSRADGARLLPAIAMLGGAYTAIVWIIAPIGQLLSIDLAAAAALLALATTAVLAALRVELPRRSQVMSVLVLSVAAGSLLASRPAAMIRDTGLTLGPPDLASTFPAADASRCLGYVDGIVARKRAGGWRVFGWAWDVRASRPPASIRLLDSQGLPLGVAEVKAQRVDVQAVMPAVTRTDIGWSLDSPEQPNGVIAMARLADGRECRLLAGRP